MMYQRPSAAEACTGCTACQAICPRDAISMKPDATGFLYPRVDAARCTECGHCTAACPVLGRKATDNQVLSAWNVWHGSESVREASSSGGAFVLLAESILARGGVVWGAAIGGASDSKGAFVVGHRPVDCARELPALQGSKYVQSDLGGSFRQVASQLDAKQIVLFSGAACQVAGLLQFLDRRGTDRSGLYTCDLICQGVPSPALFAAYLAFLEQKYGKAVDEFHFRDQSRIGWGGYEESFRLSGRKKKKYRRRYTSYNFRGFFRPCCFACPHAGLRRPGDLTLGDLYGADGRPPAPDALGRSLVLVNSRRGGALLDQTNAPKQIADIEAHRQPRLCRPLAKPPDYDAFWRAYRDRGAAYCLKKYGRESLKSWLVYTFKPIIRRIRRK